MSQSMTQLPQWLHDIDPRATADVDPALFEAVRTAYDSPGRFYHSWSHILACLDEYRKLTFDQPRAVLLALLFHDAVYVPGRKDNEAKSAAFAKERLVQSSSVPLSEQEKIAQMILHTSSHHAVGNPSADAVKMLDIDLSILGADWPAYQAYAAGVRREFCPAVVSEFAFRIGRLKFLRAVQGQKRVFLTEEMQVRREKTARANIAREVAELEIEAGLAGRIFARFW